MHAFSRLLETLILLGALQGFILAGLLFFSAKRGPAIRLLAVLILLLALACLNLYVTGTSWFAHSQVMVLIFDFVPMIIIMPVGPLIYFYTRTCVDPSFTLNKTYRIHFYPVVIDLVPQLTAMVYVTGLIFKWTLKNDYPWGNFIDTYNVYADIPRWLSISIYLGISYRYLKTCKMENQPVMAAGRSRWLTQLIGVFSLFQLVWLCYLIPYVIPGYRDRLMAALDWYPVYIPLVVLIYWLGIKGYLIITTQNTPVMRKQPLVAIDGAFSQSVMVRLRTAMEQDRLWMDPSLNLSRLSLHTGIPSKSISATLNQRLHKSFNDFVNEYRVEAVKQRLLAATDRNLTIAGLAFECGFNSQPTFQRAFKTLQGESPSEFLSKARKVKVQEDENSSQIRI